MSVAYVTTYTSMSVSTAELGTQTITSKVVEPVGWALDHLEAMGVGKPEPVYVNGPCWRWTWEYVTADGVRCTDTVRIY